MELFELTQICFVHRSHNSESIYHQLYHVSKDDIYPPTFEQLEQLHDATSKKANIIVKQYFLLLDYHIKNTLSFYNNKILL